MHLSYRGTQPKPRTYRKKARKDYLSVAKQRNPRRKTLRKVIGKQLNDIRRNLKHIESLVQQDGLKSLSKRQYRELLVIQETPSKENLVKANASMALAVFPHTFKRPVKRSLPYRTWKKSSGILFCLFSKSGKHFIFL